MAARSGIESNRFVTGVTWVDGELWHGTWEGDDSTLRRIDPKRGEVLDQLDMPAGIAVSGLESNGQRHILLRWREGASRPPAHAKLRDRAEELKMGVPEGANKSAHECPPQAMSTKAVLGHPRRWFRSSGRLSPRNRTSQTPHATWAQGLRLTRTVIHEVIADIDSEAAEIVLIVHWIGGVRTEMRLPRRRRGLRNSTSADVMPQYDSWC